MVKRYRLLQILVNEKSNQNGQLFHLFLTTQMIPSDRRSSSSQKDRDSANRRYDTLANVDDFHSTVSSERSFYSPKKCAYLFGLLLKQEITDIDKYLRAVPRYRRYNNYFPQFACQLYFCRLRRMAVQFPLLPISWLCCFLLG